MRNRPKAVFGMAVPYREGDVTNQSKVFFLITLLHLDLYPRLITNTIYELFSKSQNIKGVDHKRRRRKNHFLYWTSNCDKQSSGWEHLFLILKKLTQHKKMIFLHLLYGQITQKDMSISYSHISFNSNMTRKHIQIMNNMFKCYVIYGMCQNDVTKVQ